MESEGLKSSGKSNDCEASLRKGNLPKAEAVREAKCVEGKAIEQAEEQNESLMASGKTVCNVTPNTGKSVLTHDEDDKD